MGNITERLPITHDKPAPEDGLDEKERKVFDELFHKNDFEALYSLTRLGAYRVARRNPERDGLDHKIEVLTKSKLFNIDTDNIREEDTDDIREKARAAVFGGVGWGHRVNEHGRDLTISSILDDPAMTEEAAEWADSNLSNGMGKEEVIEGLMLHISTQPKGGTNI